MFTMIIIMYYNTIVMVICHNDTRRPVCSSRTLKGHAYNKKLNATILCIYRMAGNFGGEFILADWRFCEQSANISSAKNFTL